MWWHHVVHVLGVDNLSGYWYGFWSGFGSDISEFAILGVLLNHYRGHKCPECIRLGRFPVEGTHFKTCHKHATKFHHTLLQIHHASKHPEQHDLLNPKG